MALRRHSAEAPGRREFLITAGFSILSACTRQPPTISTAEEAGWQPYSQAMVIDALGSPIQFNIPQENLPLRPAVHDAVRASGITAVNLTVNVQATADTSAYMATSARISGWLTEIADHPEVFALVRSTADITRAKTDRKLGIILGFQDGTPIEHDLGTIAEFHARGLRIVQLTYNVKNALGCGSLVPEDTGVTSLGRDAIAAMESAGILLDLSHCGARTTKEGIAAAVGPVAITHSGCSAVFAHPRNKDDATLKALADRGGVVGVYCMPFLNGSGAPTTDAVLDHLEHALTVCGEDHVGIGSDQGMMPLDLSGDFMQRFTEVSARRTASGIAAPREDTIPYVPELNVPRRMEMLAHRLSQRRHPDRVIEKVVGSNWLRLFGAVWHQ